MKMPQPLFESGYCFASWVGEQIQFRLGLRDGHAGLAVGRRR